MERQIALTLLCALVAGACGSKDGDDTEPSDDDSTAPDLDVDDDGITSAVDCDDGSADVGGPTIWYADADSDGFGDAAVATEACNPSEDQVENPDDCDDDDDDVHPDATERCNNHDDDCDEMVDDDDPDADLDTFYRDEDDDGYGTTGDTEHACDAPDGYSSTSTDCNDADETIRPGVADPCDGVDQDCDGPEDACRVDGMVDVHEIEDLLTAPGVGGVGMALAAPGDGDGDGYADLFLTNPGADLGAGLVYRVGAVVEGTHEIDPIGTIVGDAGSILGDQLVVVPDADGDGFDDLAVSSVDGVQVYASSIVGSATTADALAIWTAGDAIEGIGTFQGGDVTDGGTPGLVASLREDDEYRRVAVFEDATRGGAIDDADFWITGSTGAIGAIIALGDPNADGTTDVMVGDSESGDGVARIWYGPIDSDVDDGDDDVLIETDDLGFKGHWSNFGGSVALEDMDGDGRDDAAVGDNAYGECTTCLTGAIAIFESPLGATLVTREDSDALFIGGDSRAGLDRFAIGDHDGDERPDIVLRQDGEIVLAYGPFSSSGVIPADGSSGQLWLWGFPEYKYNPLIAHDLDADGSDEIVIGDPGRAVLSGGGAILVWGTLPY